MHRLAAAGGEVIGAVDNPAVRGVACLQDDLFPRVDSKQRLDVRVPAVVAIAVQADVSDADAVGVWSRREGGSWAGLRAGEQCRRGRSGDAGHV